MAVNAPSPRVQPEDKGAFTAILPRQHVLTIILPALLDNRVLNTLLITS